MGKMMEQGSTHISVRLLGEALSTFPAVLLSQSSSESALVLTLGKNRKLCSRRSSVCQERARCELDSFHKPRLCFGVGESSY